MGLHLNYEFAPPGHSVQAPIVERRRFERIEMGE
jgi:hypothetical protein